MTADRNVHYDILRALGIISIVVGHICPIEHAVIFVYGYHVALFFYITGALFNEEKHALHPVRFVLGKLKALWLPYVLYNLMFTAVRLVLVGGTPMSELPVMLLRRVCFLDTDPFAGPMWFIPFMFLALLVFEGFAFLSALVFKSKLRRTVSLAVLCAAAGAVGMWLCYKWLPTPFHLKTCALMLPVLAVGYLVRLWGIAPEKLFKWWAALPCLAVLILLNNVLIFRIDLATDHFGKWWSFYISTFCGVYVMGTLAVLISRLAPLASAFAFIGRYSFDIMAIHYSICYLFSHTLGFGDSPVLWLVPFALSFAVPPIFRMMCAFLWKQIKKLFVRKANAA